MERYADAQRCYTEAIGMLDKERKDYDQLTERSKILDELVPHTEAVHLQDSLQALAKMPEAERLAAIDRVIEALKKKEKEERLEREAAEAEQVTAGQGAVGNTQNQNSTPQTPNSTLNSGEWYFYNPMAVSRGKTQFQQLWGKRPNEDNWQRSNKTVVAMANEVLSEEGGVLSEEDETLNTANDSTEHSTLQAVFFKFL